MAISVKGTHFPQDLMRMGAQWSLTSPLRYRHGEARMTECGVRRDHATIQRGVVQASPLLEEAWHRRTNCTVPHECAIQSLPLILS
jgi:transposase-like protein